VGFLLAVAGIYVPEPLRRRKLEALLAATAEAFKTVPPFTKGLSCDECLHAYAQFTKDEAEKSILRGDEEEVQSRLFVRARAMGDEFRRQFRLKNSEVMTMAALVYRMMGIDFQGEADGCITVRSCIFSGYYPGDVCRFISSLDEGLLVGLAGGGYLTFSQRITEGFDCCRAWLYTGKAT